MKTSDMIRKLCEQMNISVSELARRLGQSPQNFGKKLKRETITLEELKNIADVMEVKFEQAFILPDGNEIVGVLHQEGNCIAGREVEYNYLVTFNLSKTFQTLVIPCGPISVGLGIRDGKGVLN